MPFKRTWPYGSKRAFRIDMIKTAGGHPIIFGLDDHGEGHALAGVENPNGFKAGDKCNIVFTKGGPLGGHWALGERLKDEG